MGTRAPGQVTPEEYSRLPSRRMFTAKSDQAELPAVYVLGSTYIEMKLPADETAAELFEWWMHTAYEDFVATVPKMLEYGGDKQQGSADLMLIGENLAMLTDMHEATDAVKQEMGCWFYLQGKIARLVSDYRQKRHGKLDTWFDATIYSMMARRIQQIGRWP